MTDIYCIKCGLLRPRNQFQQWYNEPTSARRCDGCIEAQVSRDQFSKKVKDRVKAQQSAQITPVLRNFARTTSAASRRRVKKRIEEIKEQNRLNREFDL